MRQHDPPRHAHRPTPSTPQTQPVLPLVQTPLERAVGPFPGPASSPAALDASAVSGRPTDAQTPSRGLRLLLTIPEAAEALAVCRSIVYDLVLTGQLASIKIGRSRRIPVAALEAYIVEQLRQAHQ